MDTYNAPHLGLHNHASVWRLTWMLLQILLPLFDLLLTYHISCLLPKFNPSFCLCDSKKVCHLYLSCWYLLKVCKYSKNSCSKDFECLDLNAKIINIINAKRMRRGICIQIYAPPNLFMLDRFKYYIIFSLLE